MVQGGGDPAALEKLHQERSVPQELLARHGDRNGPVQNIVEPQPTFGGAAERGAAFESITSIDEARAYGHEISGSLLECGAAAL
jgi:hypothetical protein